MHGEDGFIEDILDWRPFAHITLTTLLPAPGASKVLMSYAFGERADGGTHFEVRFAKPKPEDLRFYEHRALAFRGGAMPDRFETMIRRGPSR